MKQSNNSASPALVRGNYWLALWFALLSSFSIAPVSRASDSQSVAATSNGVSLAAPPAEETNSVVAQIRADLDAVTLKINAAITQMKEAVDSNPKQHATAVSNLAAEIRQLAANQLADNADIMEKSSALLKKMQEATARARALSKDPAVKSREIYADVLVQLEAEVSRLIDARAMVKDIRRDILAQADRLADQADAIGFAEDAHQAIIGSTAFRNALSEVVGFTKRLELAVNQIGKA